MKKIHSLLLLIFFVGYPILMFKIITLSNFILKGIIMFIPHIFFLCVFLVLNYLLSINIYDDDRLSYDER